MSNTNKIDYKLTLLDKLDEFPTGITIIELAKKTNIHRNTVSKYLKILQAEGKVRNKKVSAARVYTSTERKFLPRIEVVGFLKDMVGSLKKNFPEGQDIFKKVGRNILNYYDYPIGEGFHRKIKEIQETTDSYNKLYLFEEFYNYFDFFQDEIDITVVERNFKDRVVFRLNNTVFVGKTDDFIYFFYVICGIVEGLYKKIAFTNVDCNVENFHASKNLSDSYIEISIKLT